VGTRCLLWVAHFLHHRLTLGRLTALKETTTRALTAQTFDVVGAACVGGASCEGDNSALSADAPAFTPVGVPSMEKLDQPWRSLALQQSDTIAYLVKKLEFCISPPAFDVGLADGNGTVHHSSTSLTGSFQNVAEVANLCTGSWLRWLERSSSSTRTSFPRSTNFCSNRNSGVERDLTCSRTEQLFSTSSHLEHRKHDCSIRRLDPIEAGFVAGSGWFLGKRW
jgi:hypothetical protein